MSTIRSLRAAVGTSSLVGMERQRITALPGQDCGLAWPARRRLLGGLLLGAVAAPQAVRSQTKPMPLVGVLVSTGLQPLDYLRQGLRELGWVEGQSVAFAFRSADGNPRDLQW